MAHSYWILLACIPPVFIYCILNGYNRRQSGLKLRCERRALRDYSGAEIVYAFLTSLTIIANFLGGLYLLNQFEPVSTFISRLFLLTLSSPLTGVLLGHYAEVHYQKGVRFQALMFLMCLLPSLFAIFTIAYNGVSDDRQPRIIRVIVIDKRIQINKGGGTPLVKIQGVEKDDETLFCRLREKEVSKALYREIEIGDTMQLSIKPGALGIPWLEELFFGKCSQGPGYFRDQPG